MDFMNAIKTAFSDSRLLPKAGIVFAVFLISETIAAIFGAVSKFSSLMPFSNDYYSLATLISLCATLVTPFLTFPIWLYLKGYQFQVANTIRQHSTGDLLPEHSGIRKTLSLGGVYLTLSYAFIFPFILLTAIPGTLGLIWLVSNASSLSAPLILAAIVGLLLLFLLSSIVIFLISAFVAPAMMYLYVRTGSLVHAFSMRHVWSVISNGWLLWLEYICITLVLTLAGGFLKFALCCIPIFASAAVDTLLLISVGSVLGSIYHTLDNRIPKIAPG
jgi:hypothetical protein